MVTAMMRTKSADCFREKDSPGEALLLVSGFLVSVVWKKRGERATASAAPANARSRESGVKRIPSFPTMIMEKITSPMLPPKERISVSQRLTPFSGLRKSAFRIKKPEIRKIPKTAQRKILASPRAVMTSLYRASSKLPMHRYTAGRSFPSGSAHEYSGQLFLREPFFFPSH